MCDLVDLTTIDMKTVESEDSTADRVNQLVDIYRDKSAVEKRSSFSGADTNRSLSTNINLTSRHVERDFNELDTSPTSYENEGYIAEQTEDTEFTDGYVAEQTEATEFTDGYVADKTETTEFNESPEYNANDRHESMADDRSDVLGDIVVTTGGHQQIDVVRMTSVVVERDQKAGATQQFWVLFR